LLAAAEVIDRCKKGELDDGDADEAEEGDGDPDD
jgi:hypothetical protein